MWRGVASAGISTILGLIVLPIVGAVLERGAASHR
jgi:hypothetical protein